MSVTIKSQREIELMKKAGRVVALVFEGIKDKIVSERFTSSLYSL